MNDKKLQLAVPLALWSQNDINAHSKIKQEIEKAYGDYIVNTFSIQIPSSLDEEKYQLQVENAKNFSITHVQAPYEYENSIVNYGPALEKTLELTTHFNGDFKVNYHVGVMLSNQQEIDDYLANKDATYETIVTNFRKLADKAKSHNLSITIENEPALFVKPARGSDSLRPMIFPFGNINMLNKLIKDIDRDNVSLTFDTAHWAVSQILPQYLEKEELLEEYFPNEDVKGNIFAAFECTSWDEFISKDLDWEKCIEMADVIHLSNTTGVGVHLKEEDAKKWGYDGTYDGFLSKQQMLDVLSLAKNENKVVVIEVNLDLKDITYQEVLDFLKWLNG